MSDIGEVRERLANLNQMLESIWNQAASMVEGTNESITVLDAVGSDHESVTSARTDLESVVTMVEDVQTTLRGAMDNVATYAESI